MRSTDWNYDFSSLPCWDNRKNGWVYDAFYEIPQTDVLCCLYSITEVRMLDERGFLAILKNKKKPELVLNVTPQMVDGKVDGYNFHTLFFVSNNGQLIFLQPGIYNQKTHREALPLLILDISHNRFAYTMASNLQIIKKITQKSNTVFTVSCFNVKESEKICTKWMKWRPLEELPKLHCLVLG